MSDENRKMEIQVEVNRSEEINQLQEEKARLEIEKQEQANRISELEGDLSIIADKEFKARCEKYGLSGLDPTNQEDIKKLVFEEMKYKKADTTLYDPALLGNENNLSESDRQIVRDALDSVIPTNFEHQRTLELQANSEFELINELQNRADKGDKEAKVVLAKLIDKRQPFDLEYNGNDTKALYRKLPTDPKLKAEAIRKRSDWRPKK